MKLEYDETKAVKKYSTKNWVFSLVPVIIGASIVIAKEISSETYDALWEFSIWSIFIEIFSTIYHLIGLLFVLIMITFRTIVVKLVEIISLLTIPNN